MKQAFAVISVWFVLGSVAARAQDRNLDEAAVRAQLAELTNAAAEARVHAADALGQGGYRHREEITPALRQALLSDSDARVRAASGRALGRLGMRDAVPDLVRGLRDSSSDVRVVAAAALWRLPDPAAVPALLETLDDAEGSVREWAALALGVIRDHRSVAPLVARLADPVRAVRMAAIRALGRVADPVALAPLRAVATNRTKDIEERAEAVTSIAGLTGPEKIDALTSLLDDEDRQLRSHVVAALGQVGDALVLPALRRRLQRETVPAVRTSLQRAIRDVEARGRATPAPSP